MINNPSEKYGSVLLSFPFRVFFLLVGLYAVFIIPLWLSIYFQSWMDIAPIPLFIWHAHEIIFGVVSAAIAGFMLTAICTWTGSKPLTGIRLAALVLVWLVGRAVMIFPGGLNYAVVAIADLLFILLAAAYVSVIIFRHKNWRNLPMIALLLSLFGANSIIHLGIYSQDLALANTGKILSLEIVLLIIVLVGGRIIPAFTANWLQRAGYDRSKVRQSKMLGIASLLMTSLLLPAELLLSSEMHKAILALLAGVVLLLRFSGWQGWSCRRQPLVWVLHLGYFWVVLALWFKGLAALIPSMGSSVWIHALGVGGIGTMILGVMTRVALGHTGRPLLLPKGAVFSYWLITFAAVCRLGYGLSLHTWPLVLTISGLTWSSAFAVFLFTYWPILSRKRVDQ